MADSDEMSGAAKTLSTLGATKGGRARASVLTKEERSEIARNAVKARWRKAGKLKDDEQSSDNEQVAASSKLGATPIAPGTPYSMFRGTVTIGDMELECHVLDDIRRVFSQREVVRVLSGGRESGTLSRYIQRNPLFPENFGEGATIQFRIPGPNVISTGYEATLLVEICETYLRARREGKLKASQLKLAKQAEIVVSTCAKVGVIALIDEATGYQKVRAKHALQMKLQLFIADELQEWARLFPEEFWFELARLEGVHYSPRSRPLRWGKYIMAFVYDAVDEDLGMTLRELNPNPHYKENHHQWLEQHGREKVNNQIQQVIAVMKMCNSMSDFKKAFARVFQRSPVQLGFEDIGLEING